MKPAFPHRLVCNGSRAGCHLAGAIAALLMTPAAQSASLYWDGSTTTTVGAQGGSGTWNMNAAVNWWDGAADVVWPDSGTDNDAIFVGDDGTVTLTTVTANDLSFTSGTFTLAGAGTLTLNGTTPTITTNNSATIGNNTATVIDGSASLIKAGTGTLTLNGSALHTLTGGLAVNAGTLLLDFANLTTPTDLFNGGNALTLGGGGILNIKGKTGAGNTTYQTLGDVSVNAGGGQILGNVNSGTATNITLGTLTATAAGGSLLVGTGGSNTTGLTITTTSAVDVAGIYGGRVVWFNGTANTGYDWATATGTGPYSLSGYGSYTALPTSGGTGVENYRATAAAGLAGVVTANTLKIENTSGVQALGAMLLTLNSGGLLITGTSAASITGDTGVTTLTAGNGSGAYDLVVHQFSSAGATISAVIGDNGGNAVSLVKAGSQALTLAGNNTYGGSTRVNSGTLILSGNNGYSGSTSILPNAILQVGAGGATGNLGNTTGTITNDGTLTFNNNGTLTIANNINGLGNTNINAGTVTLTGNIVAGQMVVNNNGPTLTINPASGSNTFTAITMNQGNNQTATLNLYGTNTANNLETKSNAVVNIHTGASLTLVGDRLLMNGNNSGSSAINVYGTLTTNKGITLANANTSANPILTIKNGGVLNVNGLYNYTMANGSNSARSNGTTTMEAGSAMTLDNNDNGQGFALTQGNNTSGATGGNGTFNLNGGLLTTGRIIRVLGRSNGIFNFNGGILKTTMDSTSFLWLTNSNNYKGSGSKANVLAGGAKIDTNGHAITIPEVLVSAATPDGGLTLNDTAATPGTLTLSNTNTFNGDTNLTAGTLAITITSALQNSTLNHQSPASGTLQFGNSSTNLTNATLGGLKGDKNLDLTNSCSPPAAVTLTVGNNNQSTTYSGALGDGAVAGGKLIKSGSGTLTLTGLNAHTGGCSVSSGVLLFATTAAQPPTGINSATGTGTLAINAGGVAEFTEGTSGAGSIGNFFASTSFTAGTTFGIDTTHAGGSLTYAGSFSGAAGLTKLGSGILVLAAPHTYTGVTHVAAGTLQIDGSLDSSGGVVSVPAGGTLEVSATGSIARNVTVSGGILNLAGTLAAGSTLTVSGGTVTATAASASVGTADLSAGSGTVDAGSFPLLVTNQVKFANGASITLGGAGSSFSLSGTDLVNPGGGTRRTLTACGGILTLTTPAYPTSGLLGKWTFDSQTAADTSGNGYNGTEVATPIYSTDTHTGTGYSLSLTGANYVYVNDGTANQTAFNGDSAMTISAWVKGWPGGWNPFITKYGESSQGWQMRSNPNNGGQHLAWTCRGVSNEDFEGNSIAVSNGNWHMVTMTYNASGGTNNRCIYVDGALDKQETATGIIAATSAYLAFGVRNQIGNSWTANFIGKLDDIHFYNRALSATEIAAAYSNSQTSDLDLSTTDVLVIASTEVALPAGWTRFGNLALSGVDAALTLSGTAATNVSFDAIAATESTSIAAGVPISLRTGNVTVPATKTLTVGTRIIDGSTATALTKLDNGTLVLGGINTHTGNTTVSAGSLVLADNAGLRFVITDSSNNKITGAGSATLEGDFTIATSSVTLTSGAWTLVDTASKSFGGTFTVAGSGWSQASNVWIKTDDIDPAKRWTFTEATGVLTLVVVSGSNYDIWAGPLGYNLSGGRGGDDDGDGIINFDEYAFGLHPKSAASVNPITVKLNKTTGTFTYQRRASTGLTYRILSSTDLVYWPEDATATAAQVPGAVDGVGNQTVVVHLTGAKPLTATRLFVRVAATE